MPTPKSKGNEGEEEDDILAAFLDRMVSDADKEEQMFTTAGGGRSAFDFDFKYRPGPYNVANTGGEGSPSPNFTSGDGNDNKSAKEGTVVSYDDVFKTVPSGSESRFDAPLKPTFSFEGLKSPEENPSAANDADMIQESMPEDMETEENLIPSSQFAADKETPREQKVVLADAKAKAIVVDSKKSEGTIEWMEKFKKIGMKSPEQVTSIDDDGEIIQQGPPPQPFQYTFKAEKDNEANESFQGPNDVEESTNTLAEGANDVEEYTNTLAGERGQPEDVTADDYEEIIEESVSEKYFEESVHSETLVASELLAALSTSEDPPGEGDVETMEFEEVDQGEENVDAVVAEETDSSAESGPIPEEIHKAEKDDQTSNYDPEAEYDASASSEEEESDEDQQGEEGAYVEEDEETEEILQSASSGLEEQGARELLENGLLLAGSLDQDGPDETLAVDLENQPEQGFMALDETSQQEVPEQRASVDPDNAKKDHSKNWTLYILIIALLLLAAVSAALIVLSQRDSKSPSSTVILLETSFPSLQPSITPSPTGAPNVTPSESPAIMPFQMSLPSNTPIIPPPSIARPTAIPEETTSSPALPSLSPVSMTNLPTPTSTDPIQSSQHDTCETAIGPLMADGSSNFGTIEGSSINDVEPCGDVVNAGPGVWYTVLGTGGEMLAHTCQDTTFDSTITVFGSLCDNLICIEANDNFCGQDRTQSAVSWFSDYREVYHILVSGETTFADGSFNLVLQARLNDECSSAIGPLSVESPVPVIGSTLEATPNAIVCDGDTNDSPSVWYLVTGTGGQMTVDLCDDTDFVIQIRILTGSCLGLECIAISGVIECTLTWESVNLEDYYILISGLGADSVGTFSMILTSSDLPAN